MHILENFKVENQLYKFPSQADIKRQANQTQTGSKQIMKMRAEIKLKINIK